MRAFVWTDKGSMGSFLVRSSSLAVACVEDSHGERKKNNSRSFAPLTPQTMNSFAGPQAAPLRMTVVRGFACPPLLCRILWFPGLKIETRGTRQILRLLFVAQNVTCERGLLSHPCFCKDGAPGSQVLCTGGNCELRNVNYERVPYRLSRLLELLRDLRRRRVWRVGNWREGRRR